MARKSANNLKKGNYFLFEGEPYLVQTNDHSKSGKHGHAKSRIGCVGLFTKKKKSLTMTADTALEVPEINKRTGQIVDVDFETKIIHAMDLETYETIEVDYPFEDDTQNLEKLDELKANPELMGESQIDFWTVIGKSFATRIALPK